MTATMNPRNKRAVAGRRRWLCAGLASLCCLAQPSLAHAETKATAEKDKGPAHAWRFFRGGEVQGAMQPMDKAPKAQSFWRRSASSVQGHVVVAIDGRGMFIGLYTIRDDGRSIVGALWPEGARQSDPIVATLDIGAAPDSDLGPTEGRIRFLEGTVYEKIRIE